MCAISVIGEKSLIGSYGNFENSHGLTACACDCTDDQRIAVGRRFRDLIDAEVATRAGSVFYHDDAERFLDSPANARAAVSSGPPGGYGTTNRIGLLGYADWAIARNVQVEAARVAKAHRRRRRFTEPSLPVMFSG